ncbi:MAG: DUF4926 domain-containing protein [Rhizobacter sp.]|nr:DUF4926 domain-containing protein [Chlorobiales bacterium]
MKYKLYKDMVLLQDVPEHELKAGDVVTLVEHHLHPKGGEDGYSIEVFNSVGDTVAVTTVAESWLAPLTANDVPHVRRLETIK